MQTQTILYKNKLGTVRDSVISDVFDLAPNLRESDKIEVWRSHHKTPEEALLDGFTNSVICLTIEHNESPIAMFGIVPQSILGRTATIWFLASPKIKSVQKPFLRHSKRFIEMFLEMYPVLYNYVDVENMQSIKWLQWCKAQFSLAMPYGIEKMPFKYFQFVRN